MFLKTAPSPQNRPGGGSANSGGFARFSEAATHSSKYPRCAKLGPVAPSKWGDFAESRLIGRPAKKNARGKPRGGKPAGRNRAGKNVRGRTVGGKPRGAKTRRETPAGKNPAGQNGRGRTVGAETSGGKRPGGNPRGAIPYAQFNNGIPRGPLLNRPHIGAAHAKRDISRILRRPLKFIELSPLLNYCVISPAYSKGGRPNGADKAKRGISRI